MPCFFPISVASSLEKSTPGNFSSCCFFSMIFIHPFISGRSPGRQSFLHHGWIGTRHLDSLSIKQFPVHARPPPVHDRNWLRFHRPDPFQQHEPAVCRFLRKFPYRPSPDPGCEMQGLVVDLRQNSGVLFSRRSAPPAISPTALLACGGSKWKVSEPLQSFFCGYQTQNEDYSTGSLGQ